MSEKITQFLNQCPRLELYRENGFRRLGLRVPADTRAVVRRLDELRVTLALGQAVGGWAFAPERSPRIEELRAGTRHLQDPMRRLLDEFFWFWPLAYPDSGDDPALVALMGGDTATATAAWSEAAGQGDAAAWHNLAVYQHVLALDWLDSTEIDPAVSRALWRDAAEYWRRVLADEDVWRRVAARIEAINDPQLASSFAEQLREALPGILAKVHSLAAARLAGRGDAEGAGFQLGCITALLPEGRVEALIDVVVQPVLRRIGAQIAGVRQAGSLVAGDFASLWNAVQADLAFLQALGEPAAAACAEQQRVLAELLFEPLESCAGDPGRSAEALAHALVLLDLAPPGPVHQRAEKLFSTLLARALESVDSTGGEGERVRVLLHQAVIPGLARLALPPRSRAAAYTRLAAWMQVLAETALGSSPGLLSWALQMVRAAQALPIDADSRAALASTLDIWVAEPRVMRRPALQLTIAGHVLRVDVIGVTLDRVRIEAGQLTGICHALPGFGRFEVPAIRWSDAAQVCELPSVFLADEQAQRTVLNALYHLVLPSLQQRLLAAVRGGVDVSVGPLTLSAAGIFTADSPNVRPYASLRLATDAGGVTLSDDSDADFLLKLDPANDWNVPLLPLLLLILTPR